MAYVLKEEQKAGILSGKSRQIAPDSGDEPGRIQFLIDFFYAGT